MLNQCAFILLAWHGRVVALSVALFLSVIPDVTQAQITLSWDMNTESNLAAYTLYYDDASPDTDGVYQYSIDVGIPNLACPEETELCYTLVPGEHPGINAGQAYVFAVTAYDLAGNESNYSEEVIGTVSGTTPPVAEFSATTTTGVAPLTVAFTDVSTGETTSWIWSFGDGATSTTQHPTHTYTAPGTYNVVLTTAGPGGEDTATKSSYVTTTDAVIATYVAYSDRWDLLIIYAASSEAPDATLVIEGLGSMQYQFWNNRYVLFATAQPKPNQLTITSSLGGSVTASDP